LNKNTFLARGAFAKCRSTPSFFVLRHRAHRSRAPPLEFLTLIQNQKFKNTEEPNMFKKDSLYSINKKNPDAIVYKFANGEEHRITREDFPNEEEFLAFKAWSDEDFHTEDKRDVLAGIRKVSIDDLSEAALAVPAIDVVMERQQHRAKQSRRASDMVVQLKDKLTETQFRRLWLYHIEGLPESEIAKREGVGQRRVSTSITDAEKKIKKFLPNT